MQTDAPWSSGLGTSEKDPGQLVGAELETLC